MSGGAEALGETMRRLRSDWDSTQGGWRDQTAVQFERDYWHRLDGECAAIVGYATDLEEVLRSAQERVRR